MKFIKSIGVVVSLLFTLHTTAVQADTTEQATAAKPEFKHQHIEPAILVNPWNVPDETYVDPSVTEKLQPGLGA